MRSGLCHDERARQPKAARKEPAGGECGQRAMCVQREAREAGSQGCIRRENTCVSRENMRVRREHACKEGEHACKEGEHACKEEEHARRETTHAV
eukprot:1901001-Rhodomonas_salina.1